MRRRTLAAGALASLTLLLGGCVVEERRGPYGPREVIVPLAPPPPRVEIIPPPPRPREFVEWRPGRWVWDGHAHHWEGGAWIDRPHGGAHWEEGRWERRGEGWYWRDGGWRG